MDRPGQGQLAHGLPHRKCRTEGHSVQNPRQRPSGGRVRREEALRHLQRPSRRAQNRHAISFAPSGALPARCRRMELSQGRQGGGRDYHLRRRLQAISRPLLRQSPIRLVGSPGGRQGRHRMEGQKWSWRRNRRVPCSHSTDHSRQGDPLDRHQSRQTRRRQTGWRLARHPRRHRRR